MVLKDKRNKRHVGSIRPAFDRFPGRITASYNAFYVNLAARTAQVCRFFSGRPGIAVGLFAALRRYGGFVTFIVSTAEFYAGIAHHPVATYRFCRFRRRRRNFTRHTGRVCLACDMGA